MRLKRLGSCLNLFDLTPNKDALRLDVARELLLEREVDQLPFDELQQLAQQRGGWRENWDDFRSWFGLGYNATYARIETAREKLKELSVPA